MASIAAKPTIELEVLIKLKEEEVRALDALTGYNDDAFIKTFYEHLGRHYMEPHEQGLRTFFKSIRDIVPGIIHKTDEARKLFNGKT